MPSLGSHLASARLLADRLVHSSIDADRGSYYVGSTAPDIRVITRLERSRYHFFELDEFEGQDSITRMFEEHPQLQDTVKLDAATRAFMAGYLTHLAMDEDYIERVYRQHFAAAIWGDDPRGNALDRILQYELDRREREDVPAMAEIREVLAHCTAEADVAFIARDTLGQWLDVVRGIAAQPPTWDRFPQMITRHLTGAGLSEQEIQEFCRDIPELLKESLDHVTEPRIRSFLEQSMDRSLERVRGYLS